MEASVATCSVPLFVNYITIILLLRLIGYKVHLLSNKIYCSYGCRGSFFCPFDNLFLRSSVCLINLMHCMFIKCATVCTAVDDIVCKFVMQVTQLSL